MGAVAADRVQREKNQEAISRLRKNGEKIGYQGMHAPPCTQAGADTLHTLKHSEPEVLCT